MIEHRYIDTLEDILVREAELLSKDELTMEEEIELIGIRAMKRIIAEELGVPLPPEPYEQPFNLLELVKKTEEEKALA